MSASSDQRSAAGHSDVLALLHCPACTEPFGTTGAAAPVSLSCGHIVCVDCAAGMVLLEPRHCLVCQQGIREEFTGDTGFVALLRSFEAGGADAGGTAVDVDDVAIVPCDATDVSAVDGE